MKIFSKLLILLLAVSLLTASFTGCDVIQGFFGDDGEDDLGEIIDYASQVQFDPTSGRAYKEIANTVDSYGNYSAIYSFVDGDTTHFNVNGISSNGIVKARYLGINTPESTGLIEPWGKKASNFTKEALKSAVSIILESNDDQWNKDANGRHLLWVWYKTSDDGEYRNLNLEILQAGLAYSSKISDTCYYDVALKITNQSTTHKLHVFSTERDPDFYYGDAKPMTLKELKTNIEKYENTTVSFEGVITKDTGTTAYIEEYDPETDMYYGMQIFYGYNLDYSGKKILSVGNRVKIAGSVQYYETGGTYQLADIKYDAYADEDETNLSLISKDNAIGYKEISVNTLMTGKVDVQTKVENDDGEETITTKSLDYGFLSMYSTATLKNLEIVRTYTTNNGGDSDGAISIYCKAEDGTKITLRTIVLLEDGKLVTADAFPVGSIIDAKGVIDAFSGEYQLKIYSKNDITFAEQ